MIKYLRTLGVLLALYVAIAFVVYVFDAVTWS